MNWLMESELPSFHSFIWIICSVRLHKHETEMWSGCGSAVYHGLFTAISLSERTFMSHPGAIWAAFAPSPSLFMTWLLQSWQPWVEPPVLECTADIHFSGEAVVVECFLSLLGCLCVNTFHSSVHMFHQPHISEDLQELDSSGRHQACFCPFSLEETGSISPGFILFPLRHHQEKNPKLLLHETFALLFSLLNLKATICNFLTLK